VAMQEDTEHDEDHLLPPPVMHLGSRFYEGSSGRIAVPSSLLEGYKRTN
jgi:hypothetical protein